MGICHIFVCLLPILLPSLKTIIIQKSMNMKSKAISLLFVIIFIFSSGAIANENTSFSDDYKISLKEGFEPGKSFQQSWEITYGESKRPVQVLLKKTKKAEQYIVRCNYFELKYVSTKNGFGVRPLNASETLVPEVLNNKVINQTHFKSQRIISLSNVEQEEALKLIADFLPELVNDAYKNILN